MVNKELEHRIQYKDRQKDRWRKINTAGKWDENRIHGEGVGLKERKREEGND